MPEIDKARVDMNVKVQVLRDGNVVSEHHFKNTATRLMTESICSYIAGAENSYRRGKGRPNYMGIGTMGIAMQNEFQDAILTPDFASKDYVENVTTRPWYDSTSLGLTRTDKPAVYDDDGFVTHFWKPNRGWGDDTWDDESSFEPIFQGELCSSRKPDTSLDEHGKPKETWIPIERIPIQRVDIFSDCPSDWDYGTDGYFSQAVFYGHASADWVHQLFHPEYGPQLNRIAISEFGLYEKSNLDPHGLETMLAGFRVPSKEDIVYITDGETILIEWTVSVRALMPYEVATKVLDIHPVRDKIRLEAVAPSINVVDFTQTIIGDFEPSQEVIWTLSGHTSPETTLIDGVLTVANAEASNLEIAAIAKATPSILARTTVFPMLKNNFAYAIAVDGTPLNYQEATFTADVYGKGEYSQDVIWSVQGNNSASTEIDESGHLHIGLDEDADVFYVFGTSVMDETVFGKNTITLLAKTIPFTPHPTSQPSVSPVTVGDVSINALRDTTCIAGLVMTVNSYSVQTITIQLRDGSSILGSFERELVADMSYDINIRMPFVAESTVHNLSITVEGDVSVPAVNSYVYGAFIERVQL